MTQKLTAQNTTPGDIARPSDAEVLTIMLDGGKRLCDEAIEKWQSGKYTSHLSAADAHEQIRANYYRWSFIKQRMRELTAAMK